MPNMADIIAEMKRNPRVNIQNDKGRAKTYQVRQVLKAIERLEEEGNVEK